jgi:hypothetical protein
VFHWGVICEKVGTGFKTFKRGKGWTMENLAYPDILEVFLEVTTSVSSPFYIRVNESP